MSLRKINGNEIQGTDRGTDFKWDQELLSYHNKNYMGQKRLGCWKWSMSCSEVQGQNVSNVVQGNMDKKRSLPLKSLQSNKYIIIFIFLQNTILVDNILNTNFGNFICFVIQQNVIIFFFLVLALKWCRSTGISLPHCTYPSLQPYVCKLLAQTDTACHFS